MRRLLLLALAAPVLGCPPAAPSFEPTLYDSAPVARVEAPSVAALDRPYFVDGSASYDPDQDEITWAWRLHQRPENSALAENPFVPNEDRNAQVSSFVPDVLGRYTIALSVSSLGLTSESVYAVVDVVPDGTLPEADAGPDRVTLEGLEVCLDGSGSRDPLGADLTYAWSMASRPVGSVLSSADIDGVTAAAACFTPDAAGLFTLALSVAAGPRDGLPDYVDIDVQTTNQAPDAAAEALSSLACSYVGFDGSESSDPDGDSLTYRWSLLLAPPGSDTALGEAAFDDSSSPSPTLYADLEGSWFVELSVFDGEAWSSPEIIEVVTTPKTDNAGPVVSHQGDMYFADLPLPCNTWCPAIQVTLDAGPSWDPDGDPVDLSWEVVSGGGSLDVTSGPNPRLTIPSQSGSCAAGNPSQEQVVVRVTATDCSGATDQSEMVILAECGVGL